MSDEKPEVDALSPDDLLPGESTLVPRGPRRPWGLLIVGLLFLALWVWREFGIRVARENARSQQAEINRLNTENERLTLELQRVRNEHTAMSGVARSIELKGQAASPTASGKILIEPTTRRGVAFVYKLPRANRYELWMSGPNGENRSRASSFDTRRGAASIVIENVPAEPALFTVTTADGKVFLSSVTTP